MFIRASRESHSRQLALLIRRKGEWEKSAVMTRNAKCAFLKNEYLLQPWSVPTTQVRVGWYPRCSYLLPSHLPSNHRKTSHSHPVSRSRSPRWRNRWSSWREGYSPAHSASILRYFQHKSKPTTRCVRIRCCFRVMRKFRICVMCYVLSYVEIIMSLLHAQMLTLIFSFVHKAKMLRLAWNFHLLFVCVFLCLSVYVCVCLHACNS